MFATGNVTVIVSSMDQAVRFGDHWASVQMGKLIDDRPASRFGLELTGKIEDAVRELSAKGVKFAALRDDGKAGKFVGFEDPDGNPLYLAQLDWSHVDQGEGSYPRGWLSQGRGARMPPMLT
jgi:hypothetical protein